MNKSTLKSSANNYLTHTKTNKGITLIALVITIIVMLILVAVTITMAINGGLFTYAEKAVSDTENRKKQELELAEGKIIIEGKKYNSIDEYISGGEPTLLDLYELGKLKIGDYVDYKPQTTTNSINPDDIENVGNLAAGTLTGYTTTQTVLRDDTLRWRVLGAKGDNLLLIAELPTASNISFYGHIGYNNYEAVLNNVCEALYSNREIGAVARSVNANDINNVLDKNTINLKGGFNQSKPNGGYGYSKNFTNVYTPEHWDGSYSGVLTSNAYGWGETGRIFYDGWEGGPEQGYPSESVIYSIGIVGQSLGDSIGYFVASKAICIDDDVAYFIPFGDWHEYYGSGAGQAFHGSCYTKYSFCSTEGVNSETSLTNKFLPVIELPSTVTKDQVALLEEGNSSNFKYGGSNVIGLEITTDDFEATTIWNSGT